MDKIRAGNGWKAGEDFFALSKQRNVQIAQHKGGAVAKPWCGPHESVPVGRWHLEETHGDGTSAWVFGRGFGGTGEFFVGGTGGTAIPCQERNGQIALAHSAPECKLAATAAAKQFKFRAFSTAGYAQLDAQAGAEHEHKKRATKSSISGAGFLSIFCFQLFGTWETRSR